MNRVWVPDDVLPTFQSTTLPLPAEDDGPLVATVLRKRAPVLGAATPRSKTAFLYVHGFVDYFFHEHVADAIVATGMDFYAVELRRHGRSLRAGNRGNYCTDVAQYYTEISAAIELVINEDFHDAIVLYGHSTGALVASVYAGNGAMRDKLAALVLNSPFFGFSVTAWQAVKMPSRLPWSLFPRAQRSEGNFAVVRRKHTCITPW